MNLKDIFKKNVNTPKVKMFIGNVYTLADFLTKIGLEMNHLTAIRAARFLHKSEGSQFGAREMAEFNKDLMAVQYLEKALIPAINTSGNNPLVGYGSAEAIEVFKYLFADSVVGQIIAGARKMPFNTNLGSVKGIAADWIGEGKPFILQAGTASNGLLKPFKMGAMTVIDEELDRLADIGTNTAISGLLKSANVRKTDSTFLSTADEVEGVSPAGILKDAATTTSYSSLFKKHVDNGNNLKTSFLIMPVDTLLETTGDFLQVIGKTGVTLIASQYAPGVSLMDAGNLMMNNSGSLVKAARHGDVQMDDAPTNDSVTPTATTLVSLWQTNSVAYSAVTYLSWAPVAGTTPVTVLQAA